MSKKRAKKWTKQMGKATVVKRAGEPKEEKPQLAKLTKLYTKTDEVTYSPPRAWALMHTGGQEGSQMVPGQPTHYTY